MNYLKFYKTAGIVAFACSILVITINQVNYMGKVAAILQLLLILRVYPQPLTEIVQVVIQEAIPQPELVCTIMLL